MFYKMKEYIHDLIDNRSDQRTKGLYLMDDLNTVCFICFLYVLFVTVIGPKYMENRKPYNLKNVLFYYNIFQIVISAVICYESFTIHYFKNYFRCQSVDYSMNPSAVRLLRANYLYFLSKFIELLDTVFFVLRKKNNQVTFLHIYHHLSMPFKSWITTKYYAGGSMIMIPMINSFIHVIMYTYYLLAGLGPKVQKYLWWKKYLTVLQLIQFLTGIIHLTIALVRPSEDCNISKIYMFGNLLVALLFYFLFNHFYKQAYTKAKKEAADIAAAKATANAEIQDNQDSATKIKAQ